MTITIAAMTIAVMAADSVVILSANLLSRAALTLCQVALVHSGYGGSDQVGGQRGRRRDNYLIVFLI